MKANEIESITNDSIHTIINLIGKSPLIAHDNKKEIYESLFSVDEKEFNEIVSNNFKPQENEIKTSN